MADVVVCGGGVVGLATAMMLARDGHDVTVVESDRSDPPDDPADAWSAWDRSGVGQFRQPHNLFPRARQILDEELPGLTTALEKAGGVWVDPIASWMPPFVTDRSPRPDDDRFRFVNARRPVVEAVIAQAAANESGVTVARGRAVEALLDGATALPGVPHVTGVRLADGEELHADLVIDATGRRSRLETWLTQLGARPPTTEAEDSGFVYYTRYFTGDELPATLARWLAPFGSISVLTLPSDNHTWSLTVFGAAADPALRTLRDPERFTRVIAACPLQAHWLQGEPITDVLVAGGILDRHRRLVVDDQPIVTGIVTVGDAWACTNPSAGRGISVGLLHAQKLRDVVRETVEDPATLARRFDEVTEAEVGPFFRNQIEVDRVRVAEMEAIRRGEEPSPRPASTLAVERALLYDADVFRAVVETVTCLSLPSEAFTAPGFGERVAACADQPLVTMPGPDRAQLLDLLA